MTLAHLGLNVIASGAALFLAYHYAHAGWMDARERFNLNTRRRMQRQAVIAALCFVVCLLGAVWL